MNCSEQRLSKSYQVGTVAYVFTDILFLDSHSPYFFKKWYKFFVPSCQLAFTRNTLNFTSCIYFHLDDSTRWKQYQSLSQEMIKQVTDLETVKPQEIPVKVCVIFYNIEICYGGCGEKTSNCNHLIQKQPPEVFFKERCSQKSCCNFIEKETLAQVFSCEFCEISKNAFLTEHLQTAASVNIPKEMYSCRLTNGGGTVQFINFTVRVVLINVLYRNL